MLLFQNEKVCSVVPAEWLERFTSADQKLNFDNLPVLPLPSRIRFGTGSPKGDFYPGCVYFKLRLLNIIRTENAR